MRNLIQRPSLPCNEESRLETSHQTGLGDSVSVEKENSLGDQSLTPSETQSVHVSLVEWYYCITGNRIQMLLNSLVIFLFITLSPNNFFHRDTLSPNNLKQFNFSAFNLLLITSKLNHLIYWSTFCETKVYYCKI